jgi:flavin-dependent dehydrogenase
MDDKLCDFTFAQQYTPGWNWTWQVPRAEFDKTLADSCEAKGIPVHYETEVVDIAMNDDGTSLSTIKKLNGETETIKARFIVDGSGYGRVIPTLFGLNKPSTQFTRRALFAHIKDPYRNESVEPDRITVYVHNANTWIWVIPFSTGVTSVGYVSSPDFFEQYPGNYTEQFKAMLFDEPELKKRFRDFEIIWEEPKFLQGWSATTDSFYGNGFVLTGNVTEFLDPIFSSGVTLASVSAQKAANLVVKYLQGEKVDWEADYMKPMQRGVDVFRTFVDSWYDGTLFKIFFSETRKQEMINQICSVLAGYVWDETNPFVKKAEKTVHTLARYIDSQQAEK